jgi:murein DD-endopeptidase MepM/ murein hydrolase activator NlpD
MQLMITEGPFAGPRVLRISRWQLALAGAALMALLTLLSGTVYHLVFLKAAREGWPVVSPLVRMIVLDEVAEQERVMRDNLAVMAQKVGEMQARMVRLEAMGERVSNLAGVKADELPPARTPASAAASGPDTVPVPATAPAPVATLADARGGPYIPVDSPSLEQLQSLVGHLDESADLHTDVFTLVESRLLETRLRALMVPSMLPVDASPGSGFGFRNDPFTGRRALHNGVDFPAMPGAPIRAAAGGTVSARGWHPAYGNLLEIDHGNGLVTRYAHCQDIEVALGAVVRRGQRVARVGSTGRSTGPHLHFEVLLAGVPQDPARFLPGAEQLAATRDFAARPAPR